LKKKEKSSSYRPSEALAAGAGRDQIVGRFATTAENGLDHPGQRIMLHRKGFQFRSGMKRNSAYLLRQNVFDRKVNLARIVRKGEEYLHTSI
jgi:hypothetical protein